MEETILINSELLQNIRELVKKTPMYHNEQDFIQDAILKHIRKFKNL